ncbi:MAG: FadR family transcriptional regulator [Clostridiales bacterium]|nr:FadR family transcriptional regulator [Clostridiales bacterium]
MFQKVTTNTLYENVIAQICQLILDGSIKKGDLLPSEKQLCEQFQVSRTTVREALSVLSRRKIIKTIRGKGSIVISDNFSYLNEGLRSKIHQFESDFENASQVRLLFEPQVAALVARIATKKDIDDLQKIVDMCNEKENNGTLTTDDLRMFHYRMAEITGNPVIVNIVELIVSMCDASPETEITVPNPNDESKEYINYSHAQVLQAIRAHNSEDAYFYMKENLRHFHDSCLTEY